MVSGHCTWLPTLQNRMPYHNANNRKKPGLAPQLALDLRFRPALGHSDFRVTPSNAEAATYIEQWPKWSSQCVVLIGPERCGKSHLAAVWRLRSNAALLDAAELEEDCLPELIVHRAVVIEAVDRLPQKAETALFHLLNLVAEERAWLLMTMRHGPASWSFSLPDLCSRLRATPMVALHSPDDVLLQWVIAKLLTDRHIRAEDGLIPYLAKRIERSWKAAERMVEMLDYASLSGKRRVSVALARELLQCPVIQKGSGEDARKPL